MTNETMPNHLAAQSPSSATGIFRWVCLAVAMSALGLFGWMVNDVRLELKRTTAVMNDHLPVILEQTRTSTQTLAELSEDLQAIRDLAGATGPRDRTLVTYADGILDLVAEQSAARIGVEKLIGSSLNDPLPAADWVADARKEAVWQSLRSGTKHELLDRLCRNRYGSPWRIQFGEEAPQLLVDWLRDHHPETAEVLSEHETSTPVD